MLGLPIFVSQAVRVERYGLIVYFVRKRKTIETKKRKEKHSAVKCTLKLKTTEKITRQSVDALCIGVSTENFTSKARAQST